MVRDLLYLIVLAADVILLAGLAVSILVPEHRVWPPPKRESWQYWTSRNFITIASVGVPVPGILDWNSMWISHWVRIPIAIGVMIVASAIIYKGIKTLSYHQSLGLEGELVESGPYRYSRNPQYVGLILPYAASILLTNSYLALIAGGLLIIVYAVTPLSEEPWLPERYGEAYERYRQRVTRYVGRPRNNDSEQYHRDESGDTRTATDRPNSERCPPISWYHQPRPAAKCQYCCYLHSSRKHS